MKIDTRKIGTVNGLLEWDLDITAPDGKDYPTRRPTVGDVMALEKIQSMNAGEVAELAEAVMFSDPKPPVRSWQYEVLSIAVGAYLQYFSHRAEKNSECLANAIREAMNPKAANG